MIFLLGFLLYYAAAVLARARLTELNGAPQPAHIVRNGATALALSMPLGFLSPGLWLLTLFGLAGYQSVRAVAELRSRNAAVRYLRGKGPRPAHLAPPPAEGL